MMVGSFGSVVFQASRNKILTFDDLKRSTAPRWATHDVHLKKPIPEYLGPGQDIINFTMIFDVSLGVRPLNEMERIMVLCRDGVPHRLVIGGVPFGAKQWVITNYEQMYTHFDGRGNLMRGSSSVTMKEYT